MASKVQQVPVQVPTSCWCGVCVYMGILAAKLLICLRVKFFIVVSKEIFAPLPKKTKQQDGNQDYSVSILDGIMPSLTFDHWRLA